MRAQQTRRNAWMVQHHSAESVNNSLPQSPSEALLAQQRRRSAWHLVNGVVPSSEPEQFRRAVEQQEKTLERHSNYGHRLDHGNNHQVSDGTKDNRLALWHKYFDQIQQTTRAAGFAWVRDCCETGDWKYASGRKRPEPSEHGLEHLLWHFMDLRPDNQGVSRSLLCSEARSFLQMYDELPIKGKSRRLAKWEAKELDIARFWMVMEMIGTNALETEKKYGFVVTEEEEKRAMLGLAPNVVGGAISHKLHILPLPTKTPIYKPKIFEWTHVKDWANVRDYELPLRQNSDLSELPRKQ
ncbi:MAG: hypothetical protein Q9184_006846, partial [Pyrenodesmia sp. 2 TL-2023]